MTIPNTLKYVKMPSRTVFKEHIESTFEEDFSWENHGDIWLIDNPNRVACNGLTGPTGKTKCGDPNHGHYHYSNFKAIRK